VDSHEAYRLVTLRNGARSIHSLRHKETMHPGLGPADEARLLYVEQIALVERAQRCRSELVLWDVGLGAAANALTVLHALFLSQANRTIRLISFDETLEPLRFAYAHRSQLPYFAGFDSLVEQLLATGTATLSHEGARMHWTWRAGDFPALVQRQQLQGLPSPDVILFDPWSPAKNPAMWTAGLFDGLFRRLPADRPCVLPTYSRSTMLRVSLLLAGFWVGTGPPVGRKEETTIAANVPAEISRPLERRWLERAARSDCAEPLWEPTYRRAPLSAATLERLRQHPQFQGRE